MFFLKIGQKIKDLNLISKKYRNKRIAEFLRDLELIEAKHTGIPKVKKASANNKSKTLEIDMDDNRQYVSIKGYVHEKFNNLEETKDNKVSVKQRIINLLQNRELTLTEILRELGYKTIPNSIRRNIDILMMEEIIYKNKKIL